MTNRQRYIRERNEYDLLVTMREQGVDVCPIKLIGAEMPRCIPTGGYTTDCKTCIERWLNEEETR